MLHCVPWNPHAQDVLRHCTARQHRQSVLLGHASGQRSTYFKQSIAIADIGSNTGQGMHSMEACISRPEHWHLGEACSTFTRTDARSRTSKKTHRGQALLLLGGLRLAPVCHIGLRRLRLLLPAQLDGCQRGLHDACTETSAFLKPVLPCRLNLDLPKRLAEASAFRTLITTGLDSAQAPPKVEAAVLATLTCHFGPGLTQMPLFCRLPPLCHKAADEASGSAGWLNTQALCMLAGR